MQAPSLSVDFRVKFVAKCFVYTSEWSTDNTASAYNAASAASALSAVSMRTTLLQLWRLERFGTSAGTKRGSSLITLLTLLFRPVAGIKVYAVMASDYHSTLTVAIGRLNISYLTRHTATKPHSCHHTAVKITLVQVSTPLATVVAQISQAGVTCQDILVSTLNYWQLHLQLLSSEIFPWHQTVRLGSVSDRGWKDTMKK